MATSDVQSETTEILYGVENTIRRGVQFMKNAKIHLYNNYAKEWSNPQTALVFA
jgi:hypothetical protein